MRELQLQDQNIGELLRAKEANQRPSDSFSKTQGLEYRSLYQQWGQLVVEDGVLWRHYAQPNHYQDWLQLLVPKQFRPQILEDVHQGIGSGHLGQVKTLR